MKKTVLRGLGFSVSIDFASKRDKTTEKAMIGAVEGILCNGEFDAIRMFARRHSTHTLYPPLRFSPIHALPLDHYNTHLRE